MRSADGIVYNQGTPYTTTMADYVQPAQGGTVAVAMAQSSWLVTNQTVFVGGSQVRSPFWQDVVGVSVSGTSQTKTAADGQWGNAGAATSATLTGNGYAQFTTAETTTYKMGGLCHLDPAQAYAGIDFAMYPDAGGNLNIYEGGGLIGTFGTYVAGDLFRIQLTGTKITYYHNGNLIWTSAATPTLPLLFGTSLYSINATINNAVLIPTNCGGMYTVTAVTGQTGAWLTNTGGVGNAISGATVGAGSGVAPGGVQGATGASGAAGTTGATGPSGASGATGAAG